MLKFDNAISYHEGQFPPVSLDHQNLMPELLAATDALARYDQMLQTLHNSEIFLAPLRRQEAVVSSRMEGTISTLDEIMQLEAEYGEDSVGATEHRSEAIETALYHRALRTAQRQMADGYMLSASLIKSMHQQLLSFGRGANKSPGAYKVEQNYIGDGGGNVSFIPTSPELLQEGMERLFALAGEERMPILLRTAICHAEFEALHPFADGNGRIGRMLITLMLWSGDALSAPHFYISRYFDDHKDEYIHRLREVSASGDWNGWCVFFLKAVRAQAKHNLEVASAISQLYEDMKPEFANLLGSKWSVMAQDYLFANPIFNNSRFRKNAGIPAQTAARFTRILVESGYIETVRESSGQISAIYRFEPLMKIVRI